MHVRDVDVMWMYMFLLLKFYVELQVPWKGIDLPVSDMGLIPSQNRGYVG